MALPPDWKDGPVSGKSALRKRYRAIRASLARNERGSADRSIAHRILHSPEFMDAEIIVSYLSCGAEVDTHAIIERAWIMGKTVVLPRCVAGSRLMRWFKVDSFEGLERGSLGILEPHVDPGREVDPCGKRHVLALVPGLAFDMQGFRLGYGGGFYDTFLERFDGISLGLCREVQVVDSLKALCAVDSHDVPVGAIATEKRLIVPSGNS